MSKVAVVGDATSVAGFRALGFAAFAVREPADARGLWGELSSGEYGVVLVTEPVFEALGELVGEVVDRAMPAVTVIPGAGTAGGVGAAKLRKAIERALGTTALTGEDD